MIYLASASPRRHELLRQLGIEFQALPAAIEERPLADEAPRDYVMRLAAAKARTGAAVVAARGLAPRPVLGADTEVVLDGKILGKPADAAQARAMLASLSGRTHAVLTAVAIIAGDQAHTALSESRVTFGDLSDAEIERYWASGEPADKAGGYAIQGRAAAFVKRIEGSYSGIVGMPLYEVVELLRKVGVMAR